MVCDFGWLSGFIWDKVVARGYNLDVVVLFHDFKDGNDLIVMCLYCGVIWISLSDFCYAF